MTNVQEALKQAIDAMIMYQLKLDSTFVDEAIIDCKAALAELGKCESESSSQPVGYLCESPDKVARIFVDKPLAILNHTNTPLYTSPISKEWVSLSDNDISDIHLSIGEEIPLGAISATEAKLKQLNTKG